MRFCFALACAGLTTLAACARPAPVATAPNVVTVHGKDYAFEAPASIPAGMTTFHFINDGPGLHHLSVVRLDSAKSFADMELALKNPGPPPAWMVAVGGPNAPDPMHDATATMDLVAGNYAFICFVDIPGNVPHFAKGMMSPLTVTPSAATAAAPASDISIGLSDYAFTLSAPLTVGTHTFSVSNSANQPHEVEFIHLAPGKSAQDFLQWMQAPNGPPPGNAIGGYTAVARPATGSFTLTLTPGDYLIVCFLPDAKDGKPHVFHGMMRTDHVS